MSISSGSVKSIESMYSDGCPVSPSLLYEQRAVLYDTRQKQRHRKAVTAYCSYKTRPTLGEERSRCLLDGDVIRTHVEKHVAKIARSRTEYPRSRTYRLRDKVSSLAMISIDI